MSREKKMKNDYIQETSTSQVIEKRVRVEKKEEVELEKHSHDCVCN